MDLGEPVKVLDLYTLSEISNMVTGYGFMKASSSGPIQAEPPAYHWVMRSGSQREHHAEMFDFMRVVEMPIWDQLRDDARGE